MTAEPDVSDLISVEQASAIIDAAAVEPKLAKVSLGEAAGRVLAEDILADRDYPPFDKSLMDGFAVRAADVRAGVELRVIGEIAAGQKPARGIAAGECMAIMTGAMLPGDADAVIPVEFSQRHGENVTFNQSTAVGKAVQRHGAEVAAGRRVLSRGTVLGPAQLAVAATVGAARLSVYRRPTAFVLATGDEVVSVRSRPPAHKIRNANNILLSSLLQKLGMDVIGETHCPDDRRRLESSIRAAMKADVVFISGGMSMGAYDFAPQVLKSLGFDLRITKVRIRPGKPFVFGEHSGGTFAFGLPGNPLSAYVCTARLAARLIRRLIGAPAEESWSTAMLSGTMEANGPREFYQPAMRRDGNVEPLKWRGSGDVFSLAAADVLIVRGENAPAAHNGDVVRVMEMK
jgi:molybdopterin molybdotransferase